MRPTEAPEGWLTIRDLAGVSGVSVASIKFYLREGLLSAGDSTRPRRAYYDGRHVRRLAVIRALRDVASLPVEVLRRTLQAVDAKDADAVDTIAPAIDALAPSRKAPPVDAALRAARSKVDAVFAGERLNVRPEAGSRETIARSMAALARLGIDVGDDVLRDMLRLVEPLARTEIQAEDTRAMLLSDKEGALELSILGSVLFEPIIIGLRRALHEHFTTALVRPKPKAKAAAGAKVSSSRRRSPSA